MPLRLGYFHTLVREHPMASDTQHIVQNHCGGNLQGYTAANPPSRFFITSLCIPQNTGSLSLIQNGMRCVFRPLPAPESNRSRPRGSFHAQSCISNRVNNIAAHLLTGCTHRPGKHRGICASRETGGWLESPFLLALLCIIRPLPGRYNFHDDDNTFSDLNHSPCLTQPAGYT